MLQAQLIAPRELILRDVPVPKPRAGEVLVKVRVALTCGTDLKTYRRGHAKLPLGPFGHEGAGEIVAVGDGVEHLQVGQPVTWMPTAPCNECLMCLRGRPNLCRRLFEAVVLGSYAEYLLINARVARVHVFPLDGLDYLHGAFVEPLACVLHAWRMLEPLPGSQVCIIGTGAMGYLHLMEARARGCSPIMVGRRAERLALARELGAVETLQMDADLSDLSAMHEFLRAVHTITNGGADVVIEATGARTIWELAPHLCAPGGKVLFYSGLAKGEQVRFEAERLHYDEITLLGSFHFTTQDAHAALQRLRDGDFPVEWLISDTRPLHEIVQVFEALDRGVGLKVAIVP
ncbi:D-arabitol-phosphate dehydrogenase [bacterium HR15]|nr:D-arabitol-phosphate dehydrogenase [bacterium HR15]